MDELRDRYLPATGGPLLTLALVLSAFLLWSATGGGSRDILVTQLLVNLILVLGLQSFIGASGILSFGHLGFATVAGYGLAVLAIPPDKKAAFIPDAPFGLADVVVSPPVAMLVGIGLALALGILVGVAVTRVGGIAATMITLALLFVTHAVGLNWIDVTGGGGGLSFVPRLDGRMWLYVALVGSAVAARWFRLTRTGRWAEAAREDQLAAAAIGIDARVPWLVAFMLSVLIVALGATLRVQQLGSISPLFFYFDLTLLTLTMLVVGGRKSVTGAILGTVIITVGNESTRFLADTDVAGLNWLFQPGLSDLFLGGAMVGFMLLRPEGLLGSWELDHWWVRRQEVRRAPPTEHGTIAVQREAPAVLRAEDITVDFGGFRALVDVTMEARSDEIVGLIGPNGAGKTTLVNVITGMVPPTQGRVELDGQDLTNAAPAQIARAGLARTFQNLRLFKQLPVAENVAVAAMAGQKWRPDGESPNVDAFVADAGLWDDRLRDADTLDYGSQRRLELARAAVTRPTFLLLDEPTSGMSDVESSAMIDHVRSTAARIGAGVVVIDHDLHFITNICDRIYVLDHGQVIASGTPEEIQRDPLVIEAYLGSDAADPPEATSPRSPTPGDAGATGGRDTSAEDPGRSAHS